MRAAAASLQKTKMGSLLVSPPSYGLEIRESMKIRAELSSRTSITYTLEVTLT